MTDNIVLVTGINLLVGCIFYLTLWYISKKEKGALV